jgi:hypothetical protein
MELGGGQDAVILVFDAQDIESRLQSFHQVRAGSARVTSEDDPGGTFMNLADLIDKSLVQDHLVDACELIIWGVGELGRMFFPQLL